MLEQAILAWKEVLGPEHVVRDAQSLQSAGSATFKTSQQIPAIIRPSTRAEVQECLRIATRFEIPVYPISGGKNWGYGSRVPVADGCVLMELARMNQILNFSEELGYVTLEPGVTQGQLFDFLQERKSGLWMDATGSSREASMIGNTLERGFGHTPYGDHFANVCGFEVVLPSGEILETGSARFQNNCAAEVYRPGLGPSLDGLFSQSNFGVVTRMTFWLMPAPEAFQAFFFRCDNEDALPGVIDALRPLRLNGTLRSAIHVGNDYKVISGIQQYPWNETNHTTPLSIPLIRKLRKEMKFGAWNGSGAICGTEAQVRDGRRLVRAALTGKVTKLQFVNNRLLALGSRFAGASKYLTGWDLSKTMELAKPLFGLLQGVPTDKPLASVYWRKKTPIPEVMDPDRDGCGLQWVAPVAPLVGSNAQELADISSEILLRHGFEPQLSYTLLTERAMICIISIAYDRDVPGEDDRASACYSELEISLDARGYVPYRLGIQSMGKMRLEGPYADLLSTIKRTLDPASILSPGRYVSDGKNRPDKALRQHSR